LSLITDNVELMTNTTQKLKTIHLSLTVPEEIDAEEIMETMYMDFFYNNRGALPERYPEIDDLMSKIELRIIEKGDI